MDMNSKLFHDEETNVVYLSPWLKDKKEGHSEFYQRLKDVLNGMGIESKVQIPFDMRSVIPAICGHSFFKYFYGCKVNVLNRYLGRQTVFFC